MNTNHYFPPSPPSKQLPWFNNFITELEPIYPNYDISKDEFEALKADQTVFKFVGGRAEEYQKSLTLFISTRNVLWSGDPENENLTFVTLPSQVKEEAPVPDSVGPNIYQRTKSMVLRLRQHPKMTEATALNLGILPRNRQVPRPDEYSPALKAKVTNGQVVLDCPLMGYAGYEIWSDDQGGTEFKNGKISVGRYWTDDQPLPAGSSSQVRSYRVRMLQTGNIPIGHYSNIVVETAVRGTLG